MAGRALVLGTGTNGFLAVVRSLGRRGIDVDGAWLLPGDPAASSRYLRQVQPLAGPAADDWWPALLAHAQREQYDLIIPTNDRGLATLQPRLDQWPGPGQLAVSPDPAGSLVQDKQATMELAERLGIPVPRWLAVASLADCEAAAAHLGYPLVVKPTCSVWPPQPLTRRHPTVVRSSAGLASAWQAVGAGPVLAQEFVPGYGYGINVLAAEGRLLAVFAHERLQEKLTGGAMTYSVSVAPDPERLAATEALLAACGYTGVANVEFRVAADGRWWLLEINGRVWASLPGALAAGADFPAWLWDLLVTRRRPFSGAQPPYRLGVRCRLLRADLSWCWRNHRADHSDPYLATRPRLRVAADLARVPLGLDRIDTLTADDPWPFVADAADWLTSKLRRPGLDAG